jgi:phage tail sheath protein FI
MPEYLAPGVYVEETSFRSKSIEGVSTSTTGFVGATRYGPPDGEPELMTSFNQFERIYGGLDPLEHQKTDRTLEKVHNYLAHAVRAFFDNGGSRLYVARAYEAEAPNQVRDGHARAGIPIPHPEFRDLDNLASSVTNENLAVLNDALTAAEKAKASAKTVLEISAHLVQKELNKLSKLDPPLPLDATFKVKDLASTETVRTAVEQVLKAASDWVYADAAVPDNLKPPRYEYGKVLQNLEESIKTLPDAAGPNNSPSERALATQVVNRVRDLIQSADLTYRVEAKYLNIDLNKLTTDISGQKSEVGGASGKGIDAGNNETTHPFANLPNDNQAVNAAITALNELVTANGLVKTGTQGFDQAKKALDTALLDLSDKPKTVEAASSLIQAVQTLVETFTTSNLANRIKATSEAAVVGLRAALKNAKAYFYARFPGAAGNMTVTITGRLSDNVLTEDKTLPQVRDGDLVVINRANHAPIYEAVHQNGVQVFKDKSNTTLALASLVPGDDKVYRLTLTVQIRMPGKFSQPLLWDNLTVSDQSSRLQDSVTQVFAQTISNRLKALETPLVIELDQQNLNLSSAELAEYLIGQSDWSEALKGDELSITQQFELKQGKDGKHPNANTYRGAENPQTGVKSGLLSLEDLEEISIVAAPGYSYNWPETAFKKVILASSQELINHCEKMRYRVAILDSSNDQPLSGVREDRALLDNKRSALYYPWIRILDPISNQEINLPPSGFVAGIYARSDVEIGVHKAPANEVVRSAIGLETLINKGQQDVLNPLGINCIRYFEGRGIRVWGARTISSDPEWKYLNVRRHFIYLEASIDRSTQWAVFEPNGERLWANIRRTVESFLENEWREGRLAGTKVEQAFFVRCDRSTMTQNDIDNGRMICLIGVAPLYPAEFVIFRIGQWTADARR